MTPRFVMSVLKGPSGTGKGTRVSQLIAFLREHETPTLLSYQIGTKCRVVAHCFPEHGFFFIGDITVSNKSGLTSWTSMDMIHSATGTAEGGREIIKFVKEEALKATKKDFACLVLEGEPMLLSDKFRPEFMSTEYAPQDLVLSYFGYTDRSQYEERIQGRSGVSGGDSGWKRSQSYEKDFKFSKEESVKIDATQCHLSFRLYDETVWKWGADIMDLLGVPCGEFAKWSETNSMLRSIGQKADPLRKTRRLF